MNSTDSLMDVWIPLKALRKSLRGSRYISRERGEMIVHAKLNETLFHVWDEALGVYLDAPLDISWQKEWTLFIPLRNFLETTDALSGSERVQWGIFDILRFGEGYHRFLALKTPGGSPLKVQGVCGPTSYATLRNYQRLLHTLKRSRQASVWIRETLLQDFLLESLRALPKWRFRNPSSRIPCSAFFHFRPSGKTEPNFILGDAEVDATRAIIPGGDSVKSRSSISVGINRGAASVLRAWLSSSSTVKPSQLTIFADKALLIERPDRSSFLAFQEEKESF